MQPKKLIHSIIGLLAAVALAIGLTACTTVQKEQTCATATVAYSVYLAVINASGTPTSDQIIAAKAAAAFLAAYCAPTASNTKAVGPPPGVDANGVLILPWFR